MQGIIEGCKVLDLNSDPSNISTLRDQLQDLCLLAKMVLGSRLMKWIVDDHPLAPLHTTRVERFKRRMTKRCQYVYGINRLIRRAKRLPPISHDWVTMDFAGSGEGPFSVPSPSASDGVANIIGKPLNNSSQERAAKIFGPHSEAWDKWAKGNAHVHAELRIVLHFSQSSSPNSAAHAIGVSKRSCLACSLWIETHNKLFETQWLTSGCHGKPYPDWALPGDACPYQSGDHQVDQEVVMEVNQQVRDEVRFRYGGVTSYSNSLILRWMRHDIEAMSGANNTVTILLKIGGVEGTYRSILLGKNTRKIILSRNVKGRQT